MEPPPDDLETLLQPFSLAKLEEDPNTTYAIDPTGRLLYVNPAWRAFARANGGEPHLSTRWPVGTDLFAAIPPPLQPFYRALFGVTVKEGPRPVAGPVKHCYECSSPALFRRFQMSVYPLRRGILVVNALLVEHPHDPETRPPCSPGDDYFDAGGVAHQCCHCRRMSNLAHPGRWDWVPARVERFPPRTSHTICELCFAAYYGAASPKGERATG